jgi:hypothetical protein
MVFYKSLTQPLCLPHSVGQMLAQCNDKITRARLRKSPDLLKMLETIVFLYPTRGQS